MMPRVEFVEQFLRAAVPEIKHEFDQVNRATVGTLSGERKLLIALLETAVEDYRCGHRAPTMHRNCNHCEAADWIGGDDESYPLSFVAVCDHLGFDPEWVRAQLMAKRRAA